MPLGFLVTLKFLPLLLECSTEIILTSNAYSSLLLITNAAYTRTDHNTYIFFSPNITCIENKSLRVIDHM